MRVIEPLSSDWNMQSSQQIEVDDDKISESDYESKSWYVVDIPSTVVNGLFQNKMIDNPYEGMNLQELEGYKHHVDGQNFESHEKPEGSPYVNSWWFRKEFQISTLENRQFWLDLQGINYRANLWVNGKCIKTEDEIKGSYQQFLINITEYVKSDNIIALEVFSPKPCDLGISFVDWSPLPPDDNMGIWRPINLITTGNVFLDQPFVDCDLSDDLNTVNLNVSFKVRNLSDKTRDIVVTGLIDDISFSKTVRLQGQEVKYVQLSSSEFKELHIEKPKLWWPYELGEPELYTLDLKVKSGEEILDHQSLDFGIRNVEARINKFGSLIFSINNCDLLIKGAAWTPDLLLNHPMEADGYAIEYLKNLNMNAIRLEGKLATDNFWDLCNKEGILVLAGWVCCSHWEKWDKWTEEHKKVAIGSLRSQLIRLRNHPSFICWMYGSDFPPPSDIEKLYIELMDDLHPKLPRLSSASATPSEITGPTGVKMTGPYTYVPPLYWYSKGRVGEATGFNTETGPDLCIPVIETLEKMFDIDNDLIQSDVWKFHAGLGAFDDTSIVEKVVQERLGGFDDVIEFAKQSQIVAYEAWRSMYEAHIRNFPKATGVIGWMLNSPWPSLIWQLYDFYYNPNGAFYGAQKACSPLHIFYSYDDHSIWLANSTLKEYDNLQIQIEVLDWNQTTFYTEKIENVSIGTISKKLVQKLPKFDLDPIYFIKLSLAGSMGNYHNFYWISISQDELEEEDGWPHTKLETSADYSRLKSLPKASISLDYELLDELPSTIGLWTGSAKTGNMQGIKIVVTNVSRNLAFFLRLRLVDEHEEFIAPVFLNDNCISLLSGETRIIHGYYPKSAIGGKISVRVESLNLGN